MYALSKCVKNIFFFLLKFSIFTSDFFFFFFFFILHGQVFIMQTCDSFSLSLRLAMKDVSSGMDAGALVFLDGLRKLPSSLLASVDGSCFLRCKPCGGAVFFPCEKYNIEQK